MKCNRECKQLPAKHQKASSVCKAVNTAAVISSWENTAEQAMYLTAEDVKMLNVVCTWCLKMSRRCSSNLPSLKKPPAASNIFPCWSAPTSIFPWSSPGTPGPTHPSQAAAGAPTPPATHNLSTWTANKIFHQVLCATTKQSPVD